MTIDAEVPKYRKKSKAKGQPRSNHKHEYETVLLVRHYTVPELATGKQIDRESKVPTRVCQICGRIEYVDHDDSYYTLTKIDNVPFRLFDKQLSKKACSLPIWHAGSFGEPLSN